MIKPEKLLCKRSLIIGDHPSYTYLPGLRIEVDNRMLVAGDWYDVVYNDNDGDNTFTIRDHQGKPHLFYIYTEEDKKDWPDICKDYGPRDYAKWFYTPQELKKRNERRFRKQNEEAVRG